MTHQVWFHGTRPEHVPAIRARGLQTPHGVMAPGKWFQLTDSREQAEHYAGPGGHVLEYHIPHELTNHRMNDDALLWPKHPHDYGDVSAHAVAPRQPIGAEYIADEHVVPDHHHGSRLGFSREASMDLDFHHEEQENGGSKWPDSHTIHGVHPETGERVGFLKYRTPRRSADKIKIDRLEVDPQHKGNGYAGQLMDHLQERHPRTPIDHGDRTDEGKAWWASYTRGKSVSRGRTAGSGLGFTEAAGPLYHGTSRDLDHVVPADQHGQGEVSTGLTRTDRAYATHDPQMAQSYAEMSGIDTGGRPRVYQVEHNGPKHALEPDPGYDADVRSPHGFRVLREVPEHELMRMTRRGAQEPRHCPCGMPVEFDPSDGWQHADGSISHDGEFYPHSVSDLMKARDRGVQRLGHVPAAALYDRPERWQFKQHEWDTHDRHNIEHTKSFGNYTLHAQPKYDDGDRQLHVTTPEGQVVGEAYTGEHPSRPGHIELAPEVHPDHRRKGIGTALYNYAEELAGRPAAPASEHTDAAEAFWQSRRHKEARYTAPTRRLFGPTYGLDTRLWDGEQLKPTIRDSIIRQFTEFCERHGYRDWPRWAKIVFFGSEASEWTSKSLHGNNDFDLSIGIHYFSFRLHYHPDLYTSDADIAARFTEEMHAELNDPQHHFPGVEGVYDQTWFANLQGWDIAEIRPYAAWDVVAEMWLVRPPHLPDWSLKDFPEGAGIAEEVKGMVQAAEGILAMPEPYRTQNGAAFWEFVHANRSDAFGPNGEGWWDPRNVIEKALDQKGLMQKLFECHRRAAEDPTSLAAPADWSNSPAPAR